MHRGVPYHAAATGFVVRQKGLAEGASTNAAHQSIPPVRPAAHHPRVHTTTNNKRRLSLLLPGRHAHLADAEAGGHGMLGGRQLAIYLTGTSGEVAHGRAALLYMATRNTCWRLLQQQHQQQRKQRNRKLGLERLDSKSYPPGATWC